ncbi:MAG: hypothetical protein WCV67_19945, partial [Victivallaceae bacterium]
SLIFDLLKKELQYILHHIIVANLRNTKKFCIYSHYSIGAPLYYVCKGRKQQAVRAVFSLAQGRPTMLSSGLSVLLYRGLSTLFN